jgi:hypothetical protein
MAETRLDARITEADKRMPGQISPPFQILRKILPYTTVASILALLYVGWVFYSRWSYSRDMQREEDRKAVEEAKRIDALYGSGQLKILNFYASPGVVARGEATELCYGVANSSAVTIEPGVPDVKPSLARCIEVKPRRSTTYTLTASDSQGHHATQSINVTIR